MPTMPRSPEPRTTIEVHKFGGAALADGVAMRHATEIVRERRDASCVVVVSALSGVTDGLLALARCAVAGQSAAAHDERCRLEERHLAVIEGIVEVPAGLDTPDGPRPLRDEVTRELDGLRRVVADVGAARELTPQASDAILAHGERLAARIFTALLLDGGLPAQFVDATRLIHTDGRFGNAAPDLPQTERAARDVLRPLLDREVIPVIPGFTGAGPDGAVVTLGRGGSDLTATLLGRAIGAGRVYLWKDVPGILTADPRVVPTARTVERISAREAAELAYYGAKVLHPRALIPLDGPMRVLVRPFGDPRAPGTEISARGAATGSPVRALSAISGQALVTVSGNGMLGVPGIAARTFGALAEAGISVSLISQASSEHSICFTVPERDAPEAQARLRGAFAAELRRREIDGVEVLAGLATIAVVGASMARTPGVAARIFDALGRAAINVIAIAQGSSELNVSLVVEGESAADALRAIHAAFQLDKRGGGQVRRAERADVVLLGFGRIGRELAAHLRSSGPDTRSRLRIVGIIDRGGFLFDARGLADRRIAAAALAKGHRTSVAELPGGHRASAVEALRQVAEHALVRPILVDVASGDTRAVVLAALDHGMDLVLANKVPLSSDRRTALALLHGARRKGCRVLHEATVGAGLPIIDTFEKLVAGGDRVHSIEGCPSGTLGFLFGELGRGTPFSNAIRRALALGYTEPDPRDDLSGLDVARKALILARLLGFEGELEDVEVESLVPESLGGVPLAEFLSRVGELDAAWTERVAKAAAHGTVLRYRARATRRAVRVGLVQVPLHSPLAGLSGTDNQFTFTTMRYRKNPLIITGPGAGPAVTAAGVLTDLLKIAGEREPYRVASRHSTLT